MNVTLKALVASAALAAPLASPVAAQEVYVPLGSANAIVVVDAARDAIVGKIEGIHAVHGLAGTPDGRYLVAGSYDERPIGASRSARPTGITEDEHAAHHAQPPAAAKQEAGTVSTVSVLSTSSRAVVRRIDVSGAVHHVAIDPTGRFAVVTHPNGGTISAIDLASYEVVANVATGPLPNYAVFSPDGARVYVSNAGSGTVSEVDASRWLVRRSFDVGSSPEHVVLSGDGRTLFVNNVDDGTVSVVALEGGEVARTIRVGDTPHGIDLSDDGRTLFVSALGDDRIVSVDLATGASRKATLRPAPYHLAAVRGTGKLYVSSADRPKVWVIDQKTLAVLGEIPIGGKGHQMVQAAGGRGVMR